MPELKPIEQALFAQMVEKSAQVAEPYYISWFLEFKKDHPDEFDEEIVALQCAINAYKRPVPSEVVEALKMIKKGAQQIPADLSDYKVGSEAVRDSLSFIELLCSKALSLLTAQEG